MESNPWISPPISLCCIFFMQPDRMWNWEETEELWGEKDESLQRSERLVLQDMIHVCVCCFFFVFFFLWRNHAYVCECVSEGVCVHTKGVLLQDCVYVREPLLVSVYDSPTANAIQRAENKAVHFNSSASGTQQPALHGGATVAICLCQIVYQGCLVRDCSSSPSLRGPARAERWGNNLRANRKSFTCLYLGSSQVAFSSNLLCLSSSLLPFPGRLSSSLISPTVSVRVSKRACS